MQHLSVKNPVYTIGDKIRLYGYPGMFEITCLVPGEIPQCGVRRSDSQELFKSPLSSIVELNGKPVTMLACPIAPPAADYPHTPRFDYTDGPQELAVEAVVAWFSQKNPKPMLTQRAEFNAKRDDLSYPPIPDAELFQDGDGYGYIKPLVVHGWDWSTTWGHWMALVTFPSGWHGFSHPKPAGQ